MEQYLDTPQNKKYRRVDLADSEQKVDMVTTCPECGSRHISMNYERGELSCADCGLILEGTYIDPGPEWRAFNHEQREKRSRTGSPVKLSKGDRGLSTRIGWGNKDSYGKTLSSKKRGLVYRLRKWQGRMRGSTRREKNLMGAMRELRGMAARGDIPKNVRENAASIYRKIWDKHLLRGRSIKGMVAAALYAATREADVPRTLDEIADCSGVERKVIGRDYRVLTRTLDLKLYPISPKAYVPRFCSELNLGREVETRALEILKEAEKREMSYGKSPAAVTAGAIYLSSIICDNRRTQGEIGDITGVTHVTIRHRYKELMEELGIEVDMGSSSS